MALRGGARVPRLPHARAPAEALRGGRARDGRDAPAGRVAAPGRGRRRHPHAGAGAGRRARGRAGGDARPARPSADAAGLAAVLDGRAAAAHRARAARCGARRAADRRRAGARARASSTRRAGGSACGPLDRVHGGLSQRAGLVATFPQLEYPRAVALPATHVVGPAAVGAALRGRRAAAGRRAARARRALDLAGPRAPAAARDARGLADEAVRVLASWNRRPLAEPRRRSRQRAPGRLALLRADDAALRRRRLPRRPRHARARAGQRLRRRRRARPPAT